LVGALQEDELLVLELGKGVLEQNITLTATLFLGPMGFTPKFGIVLQQVKNEHSEKIVVDARCTSINDVKSELLSLATFSSVPSANHIRLWYKGKPLKKVNWALKKYNIATNADITVQVLPHPSTGEETIIFLLHLQKKSNTLVEAPFVEAQLYGKAIREALSTQLVDNFGITWDCAHVAKFVPFKKVPWLVDNDADLGALRDGQVLAVADAREVTTSEFVDYLTKLNSTTSSPHLKNAHNSKKDKKSRPVEPTLRINVMRPPNI